MKKSLLLITGILAAFYSYSQSFSGSIDFKYYTQKDTSHNFYLVKEPIVKLDQFGKKGGAVEGSFIFDLKAHEIKWVNPKRKLWGSQKSETPQIIRGQCIVSKTGNIKKILGYRCFEYIVRNTEENIVISYWITTDKFDFFIPLIQLWNRKDKQSIYFGQIKDLPKGSMPLLSEEKQISDGKLLTRLEAIKITASVPTDENMGVPAGFTKLDQ
ncbi:MAG: DUF4412 domain-containing protein [Bacteroidia bacterium]|nr:DUF4412 domain-containing protein [Bacteroidia bacterium]